MTPMNPIEVTDCDVSASSPDGEVTNVLDRDQVAQRLSASQIRSPSQPIDRDAPERVAPVWEIIIACHRTEWSILPGKRPRDVSASIVYDSVGHEERSGHDERTDPGQW